MANTQMRNVNNVVDTRAGRGTGNHPLSNPGNVSSISAMRARLKVISPATYTDKYLDTMTDNDMLYAIRLNDEKAGM